VIRTNNPEAGGCLKFHEILAIAPGRKVEFSIDRIFHCSKKPRQRNCSISVASTRKSFVAFQSSFGHFRHRNPAIAFRNS